MNLVMRLATGTMLSLALVSAPASARSWRGHGGHHGGHYRHHGGGIGTLGGILLGAAVLGTAAAIASDNRRETYAPRYAPQPYGGDVDGLYDDDVPGYDDGDARGLSAAGDPVEDCSRAAERQAQDGGGFARVTGIDRVDTIDGGARVRGRVEIDNGQSAYAMNFSCSTRFGEVRSLRLG